MSTFKVKLTPLTPIRVSHTESLFPVDIIPKTAPTPTPSPNLSALLDWRFDSFPPTPEELNTMFPSDFPVFVSQPPGDAHTFPEFGFVDYDALVGAFSPIEHSFVLPQEFEAELWGLGGSLFEKSEFTPDAQENQFIDSGLEEFGAFGIDFFDEPPQSPSESSSEGGHGS